MLSERDPAVVISREMGAAEVLGDDAITVNPFDVSANADALHEALRWTRDERASGWRGCAPPRCGCHLREWFQAQLDALP